MIRHGNRIRVVLSLAVFFAAAGAMAQTVVPAGTISTDTTWTLAGSPYQLQGTVTIQGTDGPDGVTTLTIEPGVVVDVQATGAFIYVGGTVVGNPGALVADGNAGGPATITFTSSGATAGDWNGIQFRGGADGSSVLRNVLVEYAGGSSWAGVQLNQVDGVSITLDEITVRDSGNYGIDAARGDFVLSDCTLESNADFDVRIASTSIAGTVGNCSIGSVFYTGTGAQVEWTGNTFNNWGVRVSRVDPDDLGSFSASAFDAPATLEVLGGTVSRDASWTAAPGAYLLQSTLTVQGTDGGDGVTTLTLEPGTELRFGTSQFLYVGGTVVGIPGALIADGDAGGPATITFTGQTSNPGTWNGIQFRGGADGSSVLRNVLVEYAGGSSWAGVQLNQVDGVSITLDEITVRDSGNYGIDVARGDFALSDCSLESNADFDVRIAGTNTTGTVGNCSIESVFYTGTGAQVEWTGNTFNNWGARISRVDPDDAGSFSANTFDAPASLEVIGGTIQRDQSWTTAPGTYVAQGTLTVQGDDGGDGVTTLTLEPGVQIGFGSGQFLYVGGNTTGLPGALVADGTAAGGPATILLTSRESVPSAGDWNGVQFRRGAAETSVLRDVTVRYAGSGSWSGIYLNHDSTRTIVLDDVTVRDSQNFGIQAASGGFDIDNCTLLANGDHDVYINGGSQTGGSVNDCSTIESVFYTVNSTAVTWTNNTFDNFGARVSRIPAELAGAFGADNTFNKVADAELELLQGIVASDATWTDVPADAYALLGTVTVQGSDGGDGITTLTLAPGTELRFSTGGRLDVGGASVATPGALVADGNGMGGPATILFTSRSDNPAAGNWTTIYFRAGASDTSLVRNARIEYGGTGGWAGIWLGHTNGTIALTDVTVEDTAGYGIYVGGETAMDQLTVRRAGQQAVFVTGNDFSLGTCTLEDNDDFDILVTGASTGTVQDCNTIESIYYVNSSPDVTWTNNTFNNWGERVSQVEPEAIGNLIADNTINLAPNATVDVINGIVESDAAWTSALGNPYAILGTVTVQGADGPDAITTVSIEPGMELRFNTGTTFQIGGTNAAVPGALVADGDAAGGPATIVFTANSDTPARGSWTTLYFRAGSGASSLLRNARIEYGGAGGWAGIWAAHGNGTVQVSGVTVAESGSYGIYAGGDLDLDQVTVQGCNDNGIHFTGSTFTLDDCVVDGNDDHDILLTGATGGTVQNCSSIESVTYSSATPDVSWTGNTFNNWGARVSQLEPEVVGSFLSDNTVNPVGGTPLEVIAGTVESDAVWSTVLGDPYIIEGGVAVAGTDGADGITTLTLEPGMELSFASNFLFSIGGTSAATPGALIADGNAAGGPDTIVFTSNDVSPAPGDWSTLYFRAGATDSLVRNVLIEYAGAGGWSGSWLAHADSQTISFEEITIRDSASYGIYAGGPFTVNGCTIESNANHDVYVALTTATANTVQNCSSIESIYTSSANSRTTWSGNTFNSWGSRTSRTNLADLGQLSTDNTFNPVPGAYLEVLGGQLGDDATWAADPGPFEVVSGSVRVAGTDGGDGRTTLQLDPGVTVRMPASSFFYVGGTSVDPGELIADGRLNGGLFDKVNFISSSPTPTAGSWNGLSVTAMGRAELHESQIRHAATALRVDGTLGAFQRVVVNRADIGLDLVTATVEQNLSANDFRNTGTAVRASGTDVTIRDSNLVGSLYGAQNLTPSTHCIDAALNWWGHVSGPSGSDTPEGCELDAPTGTGSEITAGVNFDTPLNVPPDDGDTIPCDDGDGFGDPCTGGNTVDCDDNCCFVANESQADVDLDGTGDACDTNPVLRVSSDPLDMADFAVVQDAVDATFQSGSRIEVLTGLGPYLESVRVDREQVYTFQGVETAGPVVVDGGAGPAFRIINKAGVVPMRLRDFTLQGDQGVRTAVDTELRDVDFTGIAQEAIELDAGTTTVLRSQIESPAVGARVSSLGDLDLERVVVTGAGDAGLVLDGTGDLSNVLITDGADGVRIGSTGVLDMRYTTIAGNSGMGVENIVGGTAVIDRSILWNNALDDLTGVACGQLSWSSTGVPDCSAGGDNIVGDPLLDLDYTLSAGSPCLDHGPDPSGYTGDPPTDLAGAPRLVDHDGDGLARNDCGAYERARTLTPGEVLNVLWESNFRVVWDVEPDAVEYHVYRDVLSNLSFASFGVCRDDLDTVRTDTQLDDMEVPAPGTTFLYLFTAEDNGGEEGTLGLGTFAERSNFGACP